MSKGKEKPPTREEERNKKISIKEAKLEEAKQLAESPTLKQSFKEAKIVPDILKTYPTHEMDIIYSASEKTVKLGTVLTPTDVRKQPQVNYNGRPEMFYTLLMVDPDAPSASEPRAREWQHWLVGNILGNELASGEVLSEYVGVAPPKNSGYHRYVFIVYEHANKITFSEKIRKKDDGKRGKFKTEAFAAKYGLSSQSAFAGNYFKAQYDDTVPDLLKQLGLG